MCCNDSFWMACLTWLLFYNSTSRCCSAGGLSSSALSSHTSWLVAGSTLALALLLALAFLLLLLLF
jgi:hypothetical protein